MPIRTIFCLLLLTIYLTSQGQEKVIEVPTNNATLEELKAHPEKFDQGEREEIYKRSVRKFLGKDNEAAIQGYQEMVDFGKKIEDDHLTGLGYRSMAQVELMTGKWDSALFHNKLSLPYLKSHPKRYAMACQSVGSSYIKLQENSTSNEGYLDSAEYYFNQGLALLFELKDSMNLPLAHLNRGKLYSNQKRYSSALIAFQKALEFEDKIASPLQIVNIHGDISSLYLKLNDNKNAKKHLATALSISEVNGYNSKVSKINGITGAILLNENNAEAAIPFFEKAIAYQETNKKYAPLLTNYSDLTVAHTQLNNKSSAAKYIRKAKNIYDENEDFKDNLHYLYAQGEFELINTSYKNAEEYFLLLKEKSIAIGFSNFKKKALIGLAQVYQQTNEFKNALNTKDSLIQYEISNSLIAQKNIVYDYEAKYQKELQDEQIAALNIKNDSQFFDLNKKNKQLYLTLLGLLLAGLSVAAIYYAYLTKNKSNQLLQDKNKALIAALENNKILVKEIHHRVKNNLQVVSSLLNLQSRFEKDEIVLEAINSGKFRVQSMSLLHQNLYQNENLKSIQIQKYFTDLAKSLVIGYPLNNKNVDLDLEIENIRLDVDTLVPLGLIANELITNTLKYAYIKQDKCKLHFSIKQGKDKIRMIIKDNGIGIPFTALPKKSTTMGMQLIDAFSKKIKATVEIDNFEGTEFKLTFSKANNTHLKIVENVAS